jgi:hypothetical protein
MLNEQNPFANGEVYTIQYDKVIQDKTLLASTRLLAYQINQNGYIRVGDYMKELSDSDLEYFLEVSGKEDEEEFSEIALLSEMLATAEGLPASESVDDFLQRTTSIISFFACEGLHRKGLVKLYHENMSFGPDMGDKLLVEKIYGK